MSFSLVNKVKWAGADTGTSAAIDTTGADLLVLFTSRFGSNALTPSDSKGCTWHGKTEQASASCRSQLFYATKKDVGFSVGTGHTFTWPSATWYGSCELLAFSGSDFTVDPFDQQNGATTTSGTTLSAGSVTPSTSGQLIVTAVSSLGSTHTISTGITAVEDSFDYLAGNYVGGGAAWKEHTSGAINPQWGWTTTSDASATIATFKAGIAGNLARNVTAENVKIRDIATGDRPGGSIVPTLLVEVELSGAGSGWTNIVADVLRPYGVTVRHGIQGSGPGDLVASTGTARFALDNSTQNSAATVGYYSLYHPSKRSGWALGIGCRVRATDATTGVTSTRFVGRIDAIDPAPGIHRERAVVVTAADWMDEAARWVLTPEVGEQVEKRADEILTAILAQMPRQPTATSFDTGTETYPYALDQSGSQPALSEFVKLANSEFGLIYQKADGTLKFEARHSRLLHTTNDFNVPEIRLQDLHLPSTRDEIINTVRVTTHPKIVDPLPTTIVYDQANVIEISASDTKFLLGSYRDPVTGDPIGATDVQTQVSGVDYIANTQNDGAGTNISSNMVVVVTKGQGGVRFSITNNSGGTAYLTTNHLYGRGIYDRGTVTSEARNATSVSINGERVVNFDMDYQDNDEIGQGAANYILLKYGTAFAQARSVRVVATTSTILTQLLVRDISDRVGFVETVTGLSSDSFINGSEWRILPSGHVEVVWTLAPAYDPFAGLYWILGTSTLGVNTILAPF